MVILPFLKLIFSIFLGLSVALLLTVIVGGLAVNLSVVRDDFLEVEFFTTIPREPIHVTSSLRESGKKMAFMTSFLLLIRL